MAADFALNPALLVWARKSCNLDVKAAAKKLGVKPERLGEWEAGQGSPSLPQLRKMSETYRRPLAVFLLPEPPKEFQTIRDYRSTARSDPSSSYYLALEERSAQVRREAAVELAEATDSAPPRFKLRCTLEDDPEEVGAKVRKNLGIDLESQLEWKDEYEALRNWKSAIEAKGVLLFEMQKVPLTEARGFSVFHEVFPIVALNGADSPRGRVFTLGHELTHLLLRTGGVCEFFERVSPEHREIEIFCNRVAAAMLMPRDALLAMPDSAKRDMIDFNVVGRLARKFAVSSEAMVVRLVELDRLPREKMGAALATLRAWAEAAARKKKEDEKKKKIIIPRFRLALKRNGVSFSSLVLSAYQAEVITLSDASGLLNLGAKHFRTLQDKLYDAESAA